MLTGGRRDGTSYLPDRARGRCRRTRGSSPTRCSDRCSWCRAVDGVDAGLRAVNDSRFGLQAGVFTHDLQVAFRAHRELEVGGVVIGDVPCLPRRPDALRRREGVRRRPRGCALCDGGLHVRARDGVHRHRPLARTPWPSANPMVEARRPRLWCRACRAAIARCFTPSLTSGGTRDRAPSCATCSSSPRTRQSSWTAM